MLNATTAAATYAKQAELAQAEADLSNITFAADPNNISFAESVAREVVVNLRDEVAAMQRVVGGRVFLIPEHNLNTLSDKIGKLNARAAKLGVEPVGYRITDEYVEKKVDGNYHMFVHVAVCGTSPKLAGWQFAATLEHDENGVIVRRLPGLDEAVNLTAYRNADPTNCDQCHTNRRRVDTYVVRHENGDLRQVGSSCLKDFLGGQSPQQIAQWLTYVADLLDELERDDSTFYGGSFAVRTNTLFYLTHVACMIRENGWTSRGSAYAYGGYATADAASDNIYNKTNRKTDRQGSPLWVEPTGDDGLLAAQAIDHVRALDENDLKNDYIYNLYTALKGESIPNRQYGIAASAISFYQKAVQKQVEAEKKAASNFIGEIKDKVSVPVTISRVVPIADRYSFNGGTKPLYVMIDGGGNEIKWFASRDIDGMEQGATGVLSGTIKGHEDHPSFGKSTILTRCKFAPSA